MTSNRKSQVACLAIGQGGYNGMLAMLDYEWTKAENCFYVNYASDLESAHLIPKENHIPLDFSSSQHKSGAGKKRTVAKADATANVSDIIATLKAKLDPKTQRLYVFMSSGGGSGSGAGPVISMMLTAKLDIPVEVILYKPSPITQSVEEWQNYSECLKEMSALVSGKAIRLYIADLGSIDAKDKDEAAIAVDKFVADLLYRYEEVECLSSKSNLDFADRDTLASTAQMRALIKLNERGEPSSPFVLPKGQRVARLGYEVPMGLDPYVEKAIKSLGVSVNDSSYRGLYTDTSDADPVIGLFGYTVPASLISEANDMVTEAQRKAEAVNKTDTVKASGLFDNVAEHRANITAATSVADHSDDQLFNMIG